MTNELIKKRIHIQPDEHIVHIVRKHWILLIRNFASTLVIGFFVLFIFSALVGSNGAVSPKAVFGLMLLLLIIWIILFTIWTNYYLDIWIVTDKRIINIDQISLFQRSKSTLRIERVQDVTVQKHGILQELFNFGTIRVQTASAENSISVINGIPNPNYVQRAILERVDTVTEQKNKLTHTLNTKPTHSV